MVGRGVIQFLGLQRNVVGLLGIVVLVGLGERLAERFIPIYLLALGAGASAIGLFQGLNNLLGALYSFPGGYLSDRIGARRAIFFFNILALAGFLIAAISTTWPLAIVGGCLFLAWSAVSMPAMLDFLARALPSAKLTMGISLHSLVRRIPMAIGPIFGGVLIDQWGERTGIRVAFLVAAGLTVLSLILQQVFMGNREVGNVRSPLPPGGAHPLRLFREMSPPLRHLLFSDILIRFCEQIPYAFVVLWCMKEIRDPVSASQFGILTAVEMVTAALIYLPVAHFADRLGKKPFVILTFVFFTLFPVVLMYCHSFVPLLGAFVLRGLKEFGEPARKALIMEWCPPGRKATMFGFYYLVRDLIVSVAAFGGAFLWQVSPRANFLGAFACGVVGTIWFAWSGDGYAMKKSDEGALR